MHKGYGHDADFEPNIVAVDTTSCSAVLTLIQGSTDAAYSPQEAKLAEKL